MIKKLNLGCGPDYKPNWVNLDYNSNYRMDVNHNLDKFPYPFKDEEFDYIYCAHVLEHVSDLFKTLSELQRITKKNGIIHIRVPHFSNGNGYNDLSHRRFFGWFTFKQIEVGYYNKKFNLKTVSQRFNFLAEKHPIANTLFSWFFNILPKQFYERFLCWIVPVGEIELRLKKI
jgi:ubiquinone/menaquinone biosynthesis C-methylase UbiE